jgi:hypothetical protein
MNYWQNPFHNLQLKSRDESDEINYIMIKQCRGIVKKISNDGLIRWIRLAIFPSMVHVISFVSLSLFFENVSVRLLPLIHL